MKKNGTDNRTKIIDGSFNQPGLLSLRSEKDILKLNNLEWSGQPYACYCWNTTKYWFESASRFVGIKHAMSVMHNISFVDLVFEIIRCLLVEILLTFCLRLWQWAKHLIFASKFWCPGPVLLIFFVRNLRIFVINYCLPLGSFYNLV